MPEIEDEAGEAITDEAGEAITDEAGPEIGYSGSITPTGGYNRNLKAGRNTSGAF